MLVSTVSTATAPTRGHSIYLTIFSTYTTLRDWYLFTVEAPLINTERAKWMRSQLAAYRPRATLERTKRRKNDANH